MCKMRIVVNQLVLGNRELGWALFDGKGVMELTSNQIKQLIKAGTKVCGLKIDEVGLLDLDLEGFFTTNMAVHSHIDCYKPMIEGSMVNNFYVCIGKHDENGSTVYDCISSRFEQAKFTEADLKAFLKIGVVSGGAKLEGDKIVLASLEYEKASVADPVKEIKAEEPKVVEEPKVEEKAVEKKNTKK